MRIGGVFGLGFVCICVFSCILLCLGLCGCVCDIVVFLLGRVLGVEWVRVRVLMEFCYSRENRVKRKIFFLRKKLLGFFYFVGREVLVVIFIY